MENYAQAIQEVIKEQQAIIGPLAVTQAKKVSGLDVSSSGLVKLTGNGRDVLGKLVSQYEHLFGKASVEVCREAIKEAKPPLTHEQLPENLQ